MSYVSGRLFTGQMTGLGVTATVLHPTQNCREVIIQNDIANTTNLLVGTVTNQFVAIIPGQAITFPIISLNLIYVKMASSTGTVNWIARD